MANPKHVEILKKGAEAWKLLRCEDWTAIPDLADADLSGMDLSGAVLSDADLRDADLRDANLYRANLTEADLRGAKLNHANLQHTDLSEANLFSVDLRGAELDHANLYGASLQEANLSGIRLIGAEASRINLSRADLTGANLTDVNLTSSYLARAILTNAKLTRAILLRTVLNSADLGKTILDETTLANVDLSNVIGLEEVRHDGPSTIGIDTLYRSKGNIPERFLRGAGVPDDMIAFAATLRGKPIEYYSVFISYSHKDLSFARRLHDGLQGRGIRCWLDEHHLLPGDDIYEQVDRGIRLWDKILLCCSEHSLYSWWVDAEINKAFIKEQELTKGRGKKVLALIPLNLDGSLFKWDDGKADEIKRRLAADFKGWDSDNKKFEEQFERLIRALMTEARGRETPPPTRL